MKNHMITHGVLAAALLLVTSASQAQPLNFLKVVSRVCDGVVQTPSVGERVAFVPSHNMIVLTIPTTDGCVRANFHVYISNLMATTTGKKILQMQAVPGSTTQKSSCSSELKKVPEQFITGTVDGNNLTLFGGAECSKLELVLQ
ncbi:hypothetical protein [Bdellovibrio sp. HCB274]|uniref:hypothetical protein n=1 Tax=Bdellovibrio sp. HCB274 TaxID=3394361 RepID=UPI0039B52B67